mmetsp:Transcript_15070/g.63416  ORF Transcript_15070/g.63416 Transcript_15070/m.63416 type:complete len:209 (+) Transcript_15070:1198-1824(+)
MSRLMAGSAWRSEKKRPAWASSLDAREICVSIFSTVSASSGDGVRPSHRSMDSSETFGSGAAAAEKTMSGVHTAASEIGTSSKATSSRSETHGAGRLAAAEMRSVVESSTGPVLASRRREQIPCQSMYTPPVTSMTKTATSALNLLRTISLCQARSALRKTSATSWTIELVTFCMMARDPIFMWRAESNSSIQIAMAWASHTQGRESL